MESSKKTEIIDAKVDQLNSKTDVILNNQVEIKDNLRRLVATLATKPPPSPSRHNSSAISEVEKLLPKEQHV